MTESIFTDQDKEQLNARGISLEEAERQVRCFQQPPAPVTLDRPCTVGDGIAQVPDRDVPILLARFEAARLAGRFMTFVPASGAASRMFQALQAWSAGHPSDTVDDVAARAQAGDAVADAVRQFLEGLERFAFAEPLAAALARRGLDMRAVRRGAEGGAPAGSAGQAGFPVAPVLRAVLDPDGLNYGALPKGLVLFHRYPRDARTAFEEHLVEGAEAARDAERRCRLHFTVSPESRPAFERTFDAARRSYEARCRASFEVEWSCQDPSTDTIAVDLENRPFRISVPSDGGRAASDGQLLFRPGGHGALIENLNALHADVVFIKNIDNIVPDWFREPVLRWRQLLSGALLGVQTTVFRQLSALHSGLGRERAVRDALEFVERELLTARPDDWERLAIGAQQAWLIDRLNRPIRVCGVVRNTGEPGGGPFWVRHADGTCSRQIVEQAQIDPRDARQQELFRSATHFNPVDLVCSVRDWREDPFDLRRFVDQDAVFIARKSHEGRELKALERPGLWNGAMAGWITLFVEVPLETFNPVKTVNDLLRPAHQPREA